MALARQYVKRCDIADFADPALLEVVRELIPERDPSQFAERKVWEYAQLMLFLRDTGRLAQDAEVLAVGAGDERAVFWLANHVRKVVATDSYGEGDFAEAEGAASMLADPRSHAPFDYREDHLEVRWMDGRDLDYPDDSFDVVFSLSSIEHFGSTRDIARAAAEMGRVLRPGGHAFITTEWVRDPESAEHSAGRFGYQARNFWPTEVAGLVASTGRRRCAHVAGGQALHHSSLRVATHAAARSGDFAGQL